MNKKKTFNGTPYTFYLGLLTHIRLPGIGFILILKKKNVTYFESGKQALSILKLMESMCHVNSLLSITFIQGMLQPLTNK